MGFVPLRKFICRYGCMRIGIPAYTCILYFPYPFAGRIRCSGADNAVSPSNEYTLFPSFFFLLFSFFWLAFLYSDRFILPLVLDRLWTNPSFRIIDGSTHWYQSCYVPIYCVLKSSLSGS